MAQIHPFRAYRYDLRTVGSLDRVVTQPYDKISPEMQEEYYRRSPYNVARVTKSTEKNRDPDTEYPEAGAALQKWLEDGVLVRYEDPAIYACYQDYEIEGERKTRKGFIALLDLRHSGSGVLPHERTMAEPKLDRLRLMRRTECNDDLIFMLYTDEQLTVNRILDERAAHSPPELEVMDDYGVVHRVWSLTDSSAIKKIRDAMVPEELFIADGHHRFETSLNYMRECEKQGWQPAGDESFDKRMVGCFNSADQGLTILPTHRLVRDLAAFDSGSFLESAAQYFETKEAVSAEELRRRMREGRRVSHIFGFYAGDTKKFHSLRLKEEAGVDPLMLAHGEAYRHLDVSILHALVLDRLMGIDEAMLVSQSHVDFARDWSACIRRVDEGKYLASFFLNPTTVEQVQRVALLGERMPQKSTDFYPKLLTGLLFMKMSIRRT